MTSITCKASTLRSGKLKIITVFLASGPKGSNLLRMTSKELVTLTTKQMLTAALIVCVYRSPKGPATSS